MSKKIVTFSLYVCLIILAIAVAFMFYRLHQIQKRLDRMDPFGALHPEYGADIDALRDIPFPENPTKESLRSYVFDIVLSAKAQNRFSFDDPQIPLLLKVGENNMDVLLEVAGDTDHLQNYHINRAISELASDETKPLILEALPENKELASVILEHMWENDAKDILLNGLKENPTYVPIDWVQAVVNLDDPCADEAALNYLVHGTYKHFTYEMLNRDLEVDLAPYVAKAWSSMRDEYDTWDKIMFAPVAIKYGHEDALETAIQNLETFMNSHTLREALLRHTEAIGTNKHIVDWYKKNRDRLYFDDDSRKFRVKK